MNFKGKDYVIHMPQRLARMDERVENSCKQRAEYPRCSLVIVCRERGQWQASFIREKSMCLVEVSVTEQGTSKFPEILGKLSMRKQYNVYQALFSPPMHEPGNEAIHCCAYKHLIVWQSQT